MVTQYCSSCAFRAKTNDGQDACRLHSSPQHLHIIDLSKDYCSSHRDENETPICAACGQSRLIDYTLVYLECPSEKPPIILCQSCYSRINTCAFCKSSNYCDFEQNPIQIPPIVMKTIRQGPMTMQTQIRNPDRVAETCEKGCKCWDWEEKRCLRENNWCSNQDLLL